MKKQKKYTIQKQFDAIIIDFCPTISKTESGIDEIWLTGRGFARKTFHFPNIRLSVYFPTFNEKIEDLELELQQWMKFIDLMDIINCYNTAYN